MNNTQLTADLSQSLHHAALECQSRENDSGIPTAKKGTVLARLQSYTHLRDTCLQLNPQLDGQHQNLYEYFVDSPPVDEVTDMQAVVSAAAFVQRMVNAWGLEHGIDPYTGLARVWYAPNSVSYNPDAAAGRKDCNADKTVYATAEQIQALNNVCNRYKQKPTQVRLEVVSENGVRGLVMKAVTLFASFPFILIGIEPDGYAHS